MSIQYRDNSFSEIKDFDKIHKQFLNELDSGLVKALHVGSMDEIKAVQEEVNMQDNLKELESKVGDLSAQINKNRIIDIPTFNEVEKFTK